MYYLPEGAAGRHLPAAPRSSSCTAGTVTVGLVHWAEAGQGPQVARTAARMTTCSNSRGKEQCRRTRSLTPGARGYRPSRPGIAGVERVAAGWAAGRGSIARSICLRRGAAAAAFAAQRASLRCRAAPAFAARFPRAPPRWPPPPRRRPAQLHSRPTAIPAASRRRGAPTPTPPAWARIPAPILPLPPRLSPP